jgi:hypothetical protein
MTTTTDNLTRYRLACSAYDEATIWLEQLDAMLNPDYLALPDEAWDLLDEAIRQITNQRALVAETLATAAAALMSEARA